VTIYKADLKTNIYYIIGFVILLAVTIPLSSEFSNSNWTTLIIFFLLFLAFNFMTLRLKEIHLDNPNSHMKLIYENYFGLKKTLKYDLNQMEFTYKQQAISLRSGLRNVCTLYSNNKKVARLVQHEDDWSTDEIRRFISGLLESNVKKKITGNSLKDAQI
jgi:hypothetical protein